MKRDDAARHNDGSRCAGEPRRDVLLLEDVGVPFGAEPGLTGVSFGVRTGERLVIVGPSGVGKSSLLRTIAGLAQAIAGRILVGGRDVTHAPPNHRSAVYLHQTPVLFANMSVARNVAFPLRVRGVSKDERRAAAQAILESVGLSVVADRMPSTLSGGQWHRVALARAIAAKPAVLLLDEPFTGLDPSLRNDVRDAVVAAQTVHGFAIVLVTHNLSDAASLGDRIAFILDGRMEPPRDAPEVFARPGSLAIARFLGFPNEVSGDLRSNGTFDCALGCFVPGTCTAQPGPAIAVFRADACRIMSDPGCARMVGVRHGPDRVVARVAVRDAVIDVAVPPSFRAQTETAMHLELDANSVCVYPCDSE